MTWATTSNPPSLSSRDIHVWRFPLVNGGEFDHIMPLLADDEVKRTGRFLFDKHREHFAIGRAAARMILSRYADVAPEKVEYSYDNLGKPRFADEKLNAEYRFNFSNSSDLGLLAITPTTEIGIDLERIREMSDMLGLAKRYFAQQETDLLFALPEPEQPHAFFRYWTRKEAYLKAVGKGLTFPLRNVHVTQDDSAGECRIVDINGDQSEAAKWSLTNLSPNEEYKAAVAIQRLENTISQFDFSIPAK